MPPQGFAGREDGLSTIVNQVPRTTIATMVNTQLVVLTALVVGEPHGATPCALILLGRNDCFVLKAPQIQFSPLLFVQSLFFDISCWGGCRSCIAV